MSYLLEVLLQKLNQYFHLLNPAMAGRLDIPQKKRAPGKGL